MDVARDPAMRRRARWRRGASGIAVLIAIAAVSIAVARMEPAAPDVDRSAVLVDTVKRGDLVRQVRGIGTLVSEDTRWLPAQTDGRVERILLRPGASVRADSVILELSNPEVEQQARTAQLALQSAAASLENLRVELQNGVLAQESQVATVEADYRQAQLEAETNRVLAEKRLVSDLLLQQSLLRAEMLTTRRAIEGKRLSTADTAMAARLRVQEAAVDQAHAVVELWASRSGTSRVRSTSSGSSTLRGTRSGRPYRWAAAP